MTSGLAARSSSKAASDLREGRFEMGRPSAEAAEATALGVSFNPRPEGRSGWVRTSGTWWPARASASRAGTAKGGVPANTTRKAAAATSGGSALAFLQLRADAVLLQV